MSVQLAPTDITSPTRTHHTTPRLRNLQPKESHTLKPDSPKVLERRKQPAKDPGPHRLIASRPRMRAGPGAQRTDPQAPSQERSDEGAAGSERQRRAREHQPKLRI
ncbi:hypothetical protein GCM10010397_84150 [Streptomyces spinoverrucosus]|nr:hypothetical protein GCM10010397_84150 [Streptomyces spinoverrucosus]